MKDYTVQFEELAQVKAQLSTALSLSSAYREALRNLEEAATTATKGLHKDHPACREARAALDLGPEDKGYEATHDTLEPEEPVGREVTIGQIIPELRAVFVWLSDQEGYVLADHLLATFKMERKP